MDTTICVLDISQISQGLGAMQDFRCCTTIFKATIGMIDNLFLLTHYIFMSSWSLTEIYSGKHVFARSVYHIELIEVNVS